MLNILCTTHPNFILFSLNLYFPLEFSVENRVDPDKMASERNSVRNKQLPTCPPRVEFAGGKLRVLEGCPLGNLKF